MKTLHIILLVLISLYAIHTEHSHRHVESRFAEHKSFQIAQRIASTLEDEFRERAAIFQILGTQERLFSEKSYSHLADHILNEYHDIYAVNWIDPSGVMKRVYPEKQNEKALGKNLLIREDVKRYLIEARDTRSPRMTHQLMTYQGVKAFTLYVPLYTSDHRFIGWLNAVVYFEKWLTEYLKKQGLAHTQIKIQWDRPGSDLIEIGSAPVGQQFQFDEQVLNQKFRITVGFHEDAIDQTRHDEDHRILWTGAMLLLISIVLTFLLNRSRNRIRIANENLAMKNNLLSALTHDISSPLAAIDMLLSPLIEKPQTELSSSQRQMLSRLLAKMGDMLRSVKLLHAQDLGTFKLALRPVPLLNAALDAISSVGMSAEKKSIRFDTEQISPDHQVSADTTPHGCRLILEFNV